MTADASDLEAGIKDPTTLISSSHKEGDHHGGDIGPRHALQQCGGAVK